MFRTLLLAGAAAFALPAAAQDADLHADHSSGGASEVAYDNHAGHAEARTGAGDAVPAAWRGHADAGHTGMGGPDEVDWAAASPTGAPLTPLAFGVWMLEANGQPVGARVAATLRSRAPGLAAVEVLNATAPAFLAADRDRDMRVSQEELQAFAGM